MSLPVTRVAELWVGGRGAPRFVASPAPALSWRVETETPGWTQAAARLELRRADGVVERAEVAGRDSASVAWPFRPLAPYETAQLRVTVVGADGIESEPGEWRTVEAGPLGGADWRAEFIAAADDDSDATTTDVTVATGAEAAAVRADLEADDADRRVSRFRRELRIERPVARALLSYTAHGVVDMRVDDVPVSDEELAPGWTSYSDRLLFRTVDVTGALGEGAHVLGAWVAPGWYAEHFGFDGDFRRTWRGRRALSAQLRIEFADGSVSTIVTDPAWSATIEGPVRFASIYQGER